MTTTRIDQLTDQQAITVLQLVLDRDRRLPAPDQRDELNDHIAEAAHQPIIFDDTTLQAGAADSGQVSDGALARDTLTYLAAEQPGAADTIDRAIALTDDPLAPAPRFDPISLTAGLLVVLALQTDLQVERGTNGKWRFKLHKKAMSDSTLGKLLTKLITAYTGGTTP
jgi:hypothetical protein